MRLMNMKRDNKKIIKELFGSESEMSSLFGVGVGFLNFYFLCFLWGITWEISFAIAIALGLLVAFILDEYYFEEHKNTEAKNISKAVEEFEEK
jgi:putative flippase GtrA